MKELWDTVDGAVLKKQPESIHLLDLQLKKHKAHFLSLFKNPVRFCCFVGFYGVSAFCIHCCYKDFFFCPYFSRRVLSREKKCAKPAQRELLFKVSRVLVSSQSSSWRRPSYSVIYLISESWRLWSFFWQVNWICLSLYLKCAFFLFVSIVMLWNVSSAEFPMLCSGEQQQPHFPGLTRGLVAVLLYWDGKLCVANSLRTLMQSRHGKTFTLDLR